MGLHGIPMAFMRQGTVGLDLACLCCCGVNMLSAAARHKVVLLVALCVVYVWACALYEHLGC